MECLTDEYLINNSSSLKHPNYPKFLSENSISLLQTFLAEFDSDGNIPDEKIDLFHGLWKKLLSDAITFLKSTDEREYRTEGTRIQRDVVAFGVQELYRYFEEYRSFEALLYGADRFYRDHIMHVFRVWLIGMWLIDQFDSQVRWDFNFIDPIVRNDEAAAMWCIVALAHDLGYPLDKIQKVKDKISSMMRYFGGAGELEKGFEIPAQHHFINDFILKFISSKLVKKDAVSVDKDRRFGTSIQSKYYLKFSKSLENFDHGIISYILLMKNLVYFLESDLDLGSPFYEEDARQFYIRREILRAIACHTCTDIYHLQPNSLPFILIFADELQVWGRPTFHEIKGGKDRLKLKVYVPQIDLKSIEIKLDIVEEITPGGENNAGKRYFEATCRKWHKWLRSALGAGDRRFNFCLEAEVNPIDGNSTAYKFESKPENRVTIYVNGSEEPLEQLLYP